MTAKTFHQLIHWRDFKLKVFFEGIIIGLFSGLIIVAFRYCLEQAESFRESIFHLENMGISKIIILLVGLGLIAFLLNLIVKKEPLVSGSGIPQVKGVLSGHIKLKWAKVLILKFVGGVLAIGAGLSLGREGPSVQIGAAVGQGVSRLLGRLKIEEKFLITSGASAGLAAAFNAPLAGVIFSMEELNKNFSPAILMSAVGASLSADFVTKLFYGSTSAFNFPLLPILPVNYYIYLIGLGLFIGLFGGFFNRSLLKTLEIKNKMSLPNTLIILIPLLIACLLGYFLPEVLGGGNHLIDSLGQNKYPISLLIILVLVKFFFTLISYGTGVPGGIFLPILAIGALTGNLYSDLIIKVFHVSPYYSNNFIIFAMAAYFTAVVKAPITGSILITEMTGSFSHLWALITVSTVAYLASDLLKNKPIYEALYDRILTKKGSTNNEKKTMLLIETVVCLGSEMSGKCVKQIAWPKHCLLVNIKRGDHEILPQGNTLLYAGDNIFALVNESYAVDIEQSLCVLAKENPQTNKQTNKQIKLPTSYTFIYSNKIMRTLRNNRLSVLIILLFNNHDRTFCFT
ncbi:ClC family H(+)/Cl(-) exchange transporter [Desulfosporosinus fructosivorans]|uniref:ClC family H(+)/Cl(-) exchange transporter n=1 Tax=Desulfosporosinus fructosivorans TaxID=2018669 RepID=UPI001FB061A9|nr:ClC family H(+)/Cl(-) exchange transporter [Desulfosporosinus fructosivorans]